MTVLPFPSRQLDMPTHVPHAHQSGWYDGFSRRYDTKADHTFWRPVVRADLVDVAGVADASAADSFDAVNTGDEHVWNGDRFDDCGCREDHAFPPELSRRSLPRAQPTATADRGFSTSTRQHG